jgi:hypothetical protein
MKKMKGNEISLHLFHYRLYKLAFEQVGHEDDRNIGMPFKGIS